MCVFQIDIERAPLRPMNSINEFQVKAAFNTLSDPSPSRRFPRQSNSSLDLHPPPLPRSIVRPIFHDIAGSIHPASAIVYVTEQIIDYRSERRDSNVKGTFHSCTRGNTTCSPVEITGRLPPVIYSEHTLAWITLPPPSSCRSGSSRKFRFKAV